MDEHENALAAPAGCARCTKPTPFCVCDLLIELAPRPHILVLQHPQEQDALLGTVPLLRATIPSARLRIGLSWPSLAAAWGETVASPRRWAIVYPASGGPDVPASVAASPPVAAPAALLADRRGVPMAAADIEGIVLLDGSWRQAKALWWRNAWLLKLARLALTPVQPSIYGRLRREPSRNHLSTLEAAAAALVVLGEPVSQQRALHRPLRGLMQRLRDGRPSLEVA